MRMLALTLASLCSGRSSVLRHGAGANRSQPKATHFSAAELQAALAKLPTDRPNASARVFTLDPYSVGVEQRQPRAQGAASHADRAELFYVIDGIGHHAHRRHYHRRQAERRQHAGHDDQRRHTHRVQAKGDFIMVPSGVPHQFVDLKTPVQVMSMYLPNTK